MEVTTEGLIDKVASLPEVLKGSLTWDRGKIMARWAAPDDVDRAESHLKQTLLTRTFGYNRN